MASTYPQRDKQQCIEIRLACEQDQDSINEQFNDCFLRDEPLNVYFQHLKSDDENRQVLRDNGITLLAEIVDPENGTRRLGGFLACEVCRIDAPMTASNFVLRTDYPANYQMFRMLECLDNYDVFEKFGVAEAMDMLILSVADGFRGMAIGRRLCESALELAQIKGFRVVFMDCSSAYSAAIARKLGMQLFGEVSYEDGQKRRGIEKFEVKEPHTHLRRFVQVFE